MNESEQMTDFQKHQVESMKSDRWHKNFDLVLKIVTMSSVLAGSVFAYWNFKQSQDKQDADREKAFASQEADRQTAITLREREIEQREKDFKIRFYERRMDAYMELCSLTGKIAFWKEIPNGVNTPENVKKNADNLENFCALGMGKFALVADEQVYSAFMDFYREINPANITTSGFIKSDKVGLMMVKHTALTTACRSSLQDAFPKLGDFHAPVYYPVAPPLPPKFPNPK
jgi:hypothetical protein